MGVVESLAQQVGVRLACEALAQRAETLRAAYEAHPQRFKGKMPQPGELPNAVWINPPVDSEETTEKPH
jgi:putative transposase